MILHPQEGRLGHTLCHCIVEDPDAEDLVGMYPTSGAAPKAGAASRQDLQHTVPRLGAASFVADRCGFPCQPRVSLAPWSGVAGSGSRGYLRATKNTATKGTTRAGFLGICRGHFLFRSRVPPPPHLIHPRSLGGWGVRGVGGTGNCAGLLEVRREAERLVSLGARLQLLKGSAARAESPR